jgi:group I intron endonuclease
MYSIYLLRVDGTPFYVGMSKNPKKRFKAHLSDAKNKKRNLPVHNKIRKYLKLGSLITCQILEDKIPNEVVDNREMYWVAFYKTDYKLCNLTDGGRPSVPKKARVMARKANLGKKCSIETKKKISEARIGMKFSKEHKKNLSAARKDRKITRKTRLKASKTSTGRINIKKFILTDPYGIEYTTTHGLTQFCKQHNLTASNFMKVLSGKRKHQKGWTIKRCDYTC